MADYIDVFCDKGFFTVEDTDKILKAGFVDFPVLEVPEENVKFIMS